MKLKSNQVSLLIILIITGFVFILAFSVLYIQNILSKEVACKCTIPIPLIMLLLVSLGIFVGSFISYYLNQQFFEEKKGYKQNVLSTLRFLDTDERKIVSYIINLKGSVLQSKIADSTKMSKVKVSRVLKKLEEKNIIVKEKNKKINKIMLADDLSKVFFEI